MDMSICTNIIGVVPKSADYDKMLRVFNACKAAGVEYPAEVREFFNLGDHFDDYEPPHDSMEVDIPTNSWGDEDSDEGATYEVDLSSLPKNVKAIRINVCMSY